MSQNLTKLSVIEFDALVKQAYQSAGFLLRGTMQERRNVVGSQVRFQKIGKGRAKQKAPQDDVVPMNVDYTPVTATMQNWVAPEYTDIFDQQEVNFDEKQALARVIGMAIGRTMDQIAIDALTASGTANTIAHGGVGFTFDKLLKLVEFMDKKAVPYANRFLAITAAQQTNLLSETKLTSHDYITRKALDSGSLNDTMLMGFKVKVIPEMDEGGLPIATTTRKCFAWHEFAAGYATGIDFRTEIAYINQKTSWLVNGLFKACSTVIDNVGVVEIACTES
jgi:hypothetical protein